MRTRICMAIAGVTAAALLAFGVPLLFGFHSVFENELLNELEQQAAQLRADLAAADLDTSLVEDAAKDGADGDRGELALYRQGGTRVAGAGPAEGGEGVSVALGGNSFRGRSDGRYLVALPMPVDEQRRGDVLAVVAAAGSSRIEGRTVQVALLVGAGSVVVLLAATGLGYLVAGRLAAPVEDLARAAHKLGVGDFTARAGASSIPEIDAAATSLNRTAEQLGELVRREREFSTNVAHQLRTPVAGITVTAESALLNGNGQLRPAMQTVVEQADRLGTIIDDLLVLQRDRIDGAGSSDVVATVADVAAAHRHRAESAGRSIEVRVPPALPIAIIRPEALRQSLEVLVDNALSHGRGPVTIAAEELGHAVVVRVTDAGPGVGADRAELFRRRSSAAKGSGIGLALARSMMRAEGGELAVTRGDDHPEFSLFLPRRPGDVCELLHG